VLVYGSTFRTTRAAGSASPVPTLAIGFLLAGGAAIVSDTTDIELSEGLVADGANTLADGLLVCDSEFVKQVLLLQREGRGG
jgi:hypothetical protein